MIDEDNKNESNFYDEDDSNEDETRGKVPVLLRIEIVTQPTKTIYFEGEYFDPTGMVVTAYFDNGMNIVVTNYSYTPTNALTTSDNQISISFMDRTVYQSISVNASISLYVSEPPYKTIYKVGDYFEPFGMVVKLHTGSGPDQIISNYTISSLGPLSSSTTGITISYSGYIATQPITVSNVGGEQYFDPQNIVNANIGDNPSYNLFDQSIRFSSDYVSIGRDSYALSFAIIYYSRMKDRLSSLVKGLSFRFKTNFHQYLLLDGLENSHSIYKYIDGEGYIHAFYYVETGLYYCHSSDLYLSFYSMSGIVFSKITDKNGNELHFDSDGRLIKLVNGFDSSNVKRIIYTNEYISAVYDERDENTKIIFNYTNNILSSLTFSYRNTLIKSLALNYTSGFLTSLQEVDSGNNARTLYSFLYNTEASHSSYGRLEYIEDHLAHKAYKFRYTFTSAYNDYLVDKFESGVFDANNVFISKESLERVAFSLRSDDQKTTNELRLVNQDSRYFTYSLDKNAKITASFEGGFNNDSFQTLYKEMGLSIPLSGNKGIYINGHQLYSFTSPATLSLSGIDFSDLFNNFKHFVLRMYISIRSIGVKRARAILSGSDISSCPIDINVNQYEKYQLIEIPLTRTANNVSSLSLSLSFISGTSSNVSVYIGDVYLDKKEKTTLCFKHQNDFIQLEDITHIGEYMSSVNGNPDYTVNNYGNFALTAEDFIRSVMHRHAFASTLYQSVFQTNKHPLFRNRAQSLSLFARFTLISNGSIIYDSSLGDNNGDSGCNRWFLRTESFDNSTYKVSETYYRFLTNYYEVTTETVVNNDNSTLQIETKRYNYNGLIVLTGKTHYEDETIVGSKTEYSYFNNGEIKKISNISFGHEVILYKAELDDDGYISRKTNPFNSVDISYDGYLESSLTRNHYSDGLVNSSYHKNYSYDSYKNDITQIAYFNINTNMGINGLVIDYSNNHSILSINSNPLYKIVNDAPNDSITLKRYDGSNYENVISVLNSANLYELTYYTDTYSIIISHDKDIYGRTLNQKLNNIVKATFNYEANNIESTSISRLLSVNDAYINKTFAYDYETFDCYDVASLNNQSTTLFEIKHKYDGSTEYSFSNGESYTNEQIGIYLNVKYNTVRVPILSTKYSLDAFNRLIKKERVCGANLTDVILTDSFSYNGYSTQCSYFLHKDCSNNQLAYETYSYDSYNNVSLIATFFNADGPSINSVFCYKSFAYDGFNRLTSETNDYLSINRTYSYNTDGRMEYFGNSLLSYNPKGQLSSFGSTSYTYDRYGNRKTKQEGNITTIYNWTRGKLLSSINSGASYLYDYRGLRFQKETEKEVITYFYDNNRLIGENHDGKTYTNSNNQQVTYPSFELRFFYDNEGTPTGLRYTRYYNNSPIVKDYAYIVNAFKEIIGLTYYDNNPNSLIPEIKVNYIYDAWGNHVVLNSSGLIDNDEFSIGNLNPLRYKGYYFDKESGLYYLLSRYYDPSIGQFISPDDYTYLDINKVSGYHLYAYCNNNPVMCSDDTGHMPNWVKWLIGGVTFVGAVALTYFTGGALAPVFIGMGVSILGGGAIQGISAAANGGSFWDGFRNGAADGALWGGIFALAGAGIRTIKMFRNGVAIGENMNRIRAFASSGGQITYNGMPGFKIIRRIVGTETAQELAMAHNGQFIQRMMRWGVTIVDYGIDISRVGRSVFYAMERELIMEYELAELMFFWGVFR
jgi:RHS repeat-associated protein